MVRDLSDLKDLEFPICPCGETRPFGDPVCPDYPDCVENMKKLYNELHE